jgi:hypothetical protein
MSKVLPKAPLGALHRKNLHSESTANPDIMHANFLYINNYNSYWISPLCSLTFRCYREWELGWSRKIHSFNLSFANFWTEFRENSRRQSFCQNSPLGGSTIPQSSIVKSQWMFKKHQSTHFSVTDSNEGRLFAFKADAPVMLLSPPPVNFDWAESISKISKSLHDN